MNHACMHQVMPWYVVWVGRRTGVFSSWEDTHRQVAGFSGACYMKYNTRDEAMTAYSARYIAQEEVKQEFTRPLEIKLKKNHPCCSLKDVIIVIQALVILVLVSKLM